MKSREHTYQERADDLLLCLTCRGAEGSLPDHCPGMRMSLYEQDAVHNGTLDFYEGEWWTPVRKELLARALPMLVRLGDFIGNGPNGERCELILDIKQAIGLLQDAVPEPRAHRAECPSNLFPHVCTCPDDPRRCEHGRYLKNDCRECAPTPQEAR